MKWNLHKRLILACLAMGLGTPLGADELVEVTATEYRGASRTRAVVAPRDEAAVKPLIAVEMPVRDSATRSEGTAAEGTNAVWFRIFDEEVSWEADHFLRQTSPLRQASMLQPTPFVEPRVELTPSTSQTASGSQLATRVFDDPALQRSGLGETRSRANSLSVDYIRGSEAGPSVSTDVGSLLRKSPVALSVDVQRRSPMVNDTRVRSSRIGSLAASGSHWVPARADLDTALSKIDSRNVEDVLVIPGPYSSLYGPGFHFVDFELLKSPRSASGSKWNGRTSFDHNSNGNQWLGQQGIWGGGENWGVRANYAHRTGDNYRTGSGNKIPSGYESRELTLAFGRDFSDGRSLEFSLIRLDQTDVQFPGYVFDIDYLVTDAYELAYIDEHATFADRIETEFWYNRTVFEGNAQDLTKRAQFPLLDRINYAGTTDVDSLSTGYRRALSWLEAEAYQFSLGHDLRYVKQELNEVADATTLGLPFPLFNRNSPIPRSFSVNPGVFAEYQEQLFDRYTVRTGGRVDYIQTDIVDEPANLNDLGLSVFPATYEEIVGTDQKQTDRFQWSLYTSLDRRFSESVIGTASVGFAQRPPNLTELYAAQPFLLLVQNGLNNVTGDPRLLEEQNIQIDLSLDYSGERAKFGFRVFHSWVMDYITLENTNAVRGPPNGDVQQVSLRYVNTDLATFVGGEAFAELFPESRLSPFVTLRGVDGRDRTRKGDFATSNGGADNPSEQVAGLPRGFFSGISGADAEPLPGVSPFETRIGVRLRDEGAKPRWNIEMYARIVDNQDRVASSLLELPTPGFTTWDVRSVYQPEFVDGLTLVSGIENLFDKAYREHLDNAFFINGQPFQQPGFNFYVGADWNY